MHVCNPVDIGGFISFRFTRVGTLTGPEKVDVLWNYQHT